MVFVRFHCWPSQRTNHRSTWTPTTSFRLSKHCSKALLARWTSLVTNRKFEELVESLLTEHYDPIYKRNRQRFIDCQDETVVVKVPIGCLDDNFIATSVCPRLINLSKSLFSWSLFCELKIQLSHFVRFSLMNWEIVGSNIDCLTWLVHITRDLDHWYDWYCFQNRCSDAEMGNLLSTGDALQF